MSVIICSYPRSGSTWLRFILCNLLYPNTRHDFESVNRHIPDIDHYAFMVQAIKSPEFFKSHSLRTGQKIVHLHRHVGDVLISEWWYKRKFHDDQRDIATFLEDCHYGANWRAHCDHFFPCHKSISFEQISSAWAVQQLVPSRFSYQDVEEAISKSSFSEIRRIEEESGIGPYQEDESIKFVRDGRSGQWKELDSALQGILLSENFIQLKALGYL